MKSKLFKTIAVALCLLVVCGTTYADERQAKVGDNVSFNGTDVGGSSTGGSSSTKRTSAQQLADRKNYTAKQAIDKICTDYIKTLVETTVPFEYEETGRETYINRGKITRTQIENIVNKREDFDPIGYYYTIGRFVNKQTIPDDLDWDQFLALLEFLKQYYPDEYLEWVTNLYHDYTESDPKFFQIRDVWTKISADCDTIEERTIVKKQIIDMVTYVERLDALEYFLKVFRDIDEFDVLYYREYVVEDTCESAIKTCQRSTWGNTGKTTYWLFEAVEPGDGLYHAPMEKYDGSSTSQTFYYPGRYRATGTQILTTQRCNALTYSYNEYLVLADTGQVIYRNEKRGGTFTATEAYAKDINAESGTVTKINPLEDQNLANVVYYDVQPAETNYVSIVDEYFVVHDCAYDLSVATIWGDQYSTYRIE